jgi:hypothetical protein
MIDGTAASSAGWDPSAEHVAAAAGQELRLTCSSAMPQAIRAVPNTREGDAKSTLTMASGGTHMAVLCRRMALLLLLLLLLVVWGRRLLGGVLHFLLMLTAAGERHVASAGIQVQGLRAAQQGAAGASRWRHEACATCKQVPWWLPAKHAG